VVPEGDQRGVRRRRGFYAGLRGRLIEFASIEADLAQRQGDGATLRTHLQRAAETGRVDERLFNSCPKGAESLWSAFGQIGRSRPSGFGVAPISLVEIESWQRLFGVTLTPWEIDTIIEVDAVFVGRAAASKGK
jgi:hypothetical protein